MDYKDLIVWKKSFILVKLIYNLTENFPKKEIYSLSDQMRRASISIPSNIAEGYGRFSKKQFYSFLKISLGSLCELETQLLLSQEIGYTKNDFSETQNLINEIKKIIGKILSNSNT